MAKTTRRRRSAPSRRPEQKRPEKRARPQSARKPAEERQQDAPPARNAVATLTETAAVNPFEPMERLMQAFMPLAWLRPWIVEAHRPKFEVLDRNGSVVVRAEVPGVEKNQLAVEASDVAVTIKGTVQHSERQPSPRGYRASESFESFERTVRLPSDVDSAKAKATFKDGVLEVVLPKIDRSRRHPVKL